MPWFKVDDGFAFHPKTIQCTNAALGLWVRAGSWCADNSTDGQLPRHMIGTLSAQRRDADSLVRAGLWVEEEGGYRFKDWEHYQPSKAQVDAERAAARKRQADYRERKRNGVTHAVSNAVTSGAPSRPVPSHKTEGGATRATRLPDTWKPTPEHETRAKEAGVDIDRETVKFRTHAEDKGRTSKSWNAAFTQWLIKAAEYAQRDGRTQAAPTVGGGFWDSGPR